MSMLNHFFNYKPEVLALDEKAMELDFYEREFTCYLGRILNVMEGYLSNSQS